MSSHLFLRYCSPRSVQADFTSSGRLQHSLSSAVCAAYTYGADKHTKRTELDTPTASISRIIRICAGAGVASQACQEMAAQGPVGFRETWNRLSTLYEQRKLIYIKLNIPHCLHHRVLSRSSLSAGPVWGFNKGVVSKFVICWSATVCESTSRSAAAGLRHSRAPVNWSRQQGHWIDLWATHG